MRKLVGVDSFLQAPGYFIFDGPGVSCARDPASIIDIDEL